MSPVSNDIAEIVRARAWASERRGQALRLQLGLSLEEVAAALEIDPSTLWRWEQGRSRPRTTLARQWMDLFEQLPVDLVRGA